MQLLVHDLLGKITGEGGGACESVVERRAEGVDIRTAVVLFAFAENQFGGGVERRENQLMSFKIMVFHLCQAEIGELGLVVAVDENVLRLDVAMGEGMCLEAVVEGVRDLQAPCADGRRRKRPVPLDFQHQRFAVDIFHAEEIDVSGGDARVKRLDDVLMGEGGGGPRFVDEARDVFGVLRQFRGEDFQGDVPPEIQLLG